MLIGGVVNLIAGIAMAVAALLLPDAADTAQIPLIGTGIVLALSGGAMAYVGAPHRARPRTVTEAGRRAKATVLEVNPVAGEATGYRMVELVLEVRPKGEMPFHVTRKFIAAKWGGHSQGDEIDVIYDPENPQRVEIV